METAVLRVRSEAARAKHPVQKSTAEGQVAVLGKLRVLSGRSRSKPPSIVTWFTPPALFHELNVGLLLLAAPTVVLLLLLTLCTLFSA